MRNKDRIDPFLEELGSVWKTKFPNWRFGQLMFNFLSSLDRDPFFMEEDEFLKRLKEYVDVNSPFYVNPKPLQ